MDIEPNEFGNHLRHLAEFAGAELTADELSHIAERYPHCPGKEHWDVREYARVATVGGREYRVVRGTSTQDVYCSRERVRADAVRAALNAVESRLGGVVPGSPS